MLKKLFHKMRNSAVNLNKENILNLIEPNESATILDLGCDIGTWTKKIAEKANTRDYHGIDIEAEALKKAETEGVITKKGDLNQLLPYKNDSFDCIHSDQVIEHLHNTDNFVEEIHRILKPNGYCVISTENLSSWANIAALTMGWQPFSLTNVSTKKLGIGNPLAINRNQIVKSPSWTHIKVFSRTGLKNLFEVHGFKVEKIVGAGYFPLPSILGKIDPRHSHFITIKARKTITTL